MAAASWETRRGADTTTWTGTYCGDQRDGYGYITTRDGKREESWYERGVKLYDIWPSQQNTLGPVGVHPLPPDKKTEAEHPPGAHPEVHTLENLLTEQEIEFIETAAQERSTQQGVGVDHMGMFLLDHPHPYLQSILAKLTCVATEQVARRLHPTKKRKLGEDPGAPMLALRCVNCFMAKVSDGSHDPLHYDDSDYTLNICLWVEPGCPPLTFVQKGTVMATRYPVLHVPSVGVLHPGNVLHGVTEPDYPSVEEDARSCAQAGSRRNLVLWFREAVLSPVEKCVHRQPSGGTLPTTGLDRVWAGVAVYLEPFDLCTLQLVGKSLLTIIEESETWQHLAQSYGDADLTTISTVEGAKHHIRMCLQPISLAFNPSMMMMKCIYDPILHGRFPTMTYKGGGHFDMEGDAPSMTGLPASYRTAPPAPQKKPWQFWKR